MAKSIKHKISQYKYNRICRNPRPFGSWAVKPVKDGTFITHMVWSFSYNGFVYVKVQDLSKPVKRNENPSYYRYDVAQAITQGDK